MEAVDKRTLNDSLIKAVTQCNLILVETLLGFGADPNVMFEGRSILHFAVKESTTEIIEALVRAGATLEFDRVVKLPFGLLDQELI
jgi:hypothetical protein